MDVRQIDIVAIAVGDRLRDLNVEKLERIRLSMLERGQLMPIEVQETPDEAKPYRLVYGLHRLRACQLIGQEQISANIYSAGADVDELLLREIDENLARYDLSQYDRANFIARRAEIWERQKGTIKQGCKHLGQVGPSSFNLTTAAEFGISDRDVKRHRARLKKIVPDVWARLRGTPAADNGSQLDAIARLTAERQVALVELLTAPVPVEFKAALAQVRPSGTLKPPPTPQEECKALMRAWKAASKRAQALFLDEIGKGRSLTRAAA